MRYFRPDRNFYIPKKYSLKLTAKSAVAEVYLYEHGDLVIAMGFGGKRAKPDFHIRFPTKARRQEYIENWIAQAEASAKAKAERRSKANAFEHTLKEGDILYTSWGYDQTNIDYYKVTKVVGPKSVKIRQVNTSVDHHDGCQSNLVVAGSDFKEGEKEMLKRVHEGNSITISSFEHASPWDGSPKRETDAYSGH